MNSKLKHLIRSAYRYQSAETSTNCGGKNPLKIDHKYMVACLL